MRAFRGGPAILAVVVPWAAAAAAACFDFDATMRGGPLVDGGADVGADAPDSADAAVVPDTSTGDAAEASAGPFCATYPRPAAPPFFCDDFDDGGLPGAWSTFHETSGTLADTDAAYVSPPHSLDLAIGPLTANQTLDVALRTPLPKPSLPSTLVFAFSVEPVSVDKSANATIVLGALDFLDAATPSNRYSLELAIQVQSGAAVLALGEQTGLADGGSQYVNHQLPPEQALPVATFTGLKLTVIWTGPTAEARVDVNGAQAIDVPLTMTVQPVSLQIGVGTSYVSEPSPGWELRYDNVVFTTM
jgi:hypothetical protein